MEKIIKCYLCGEEMISGDIEIVGTANQICDECEKLSGCCGADVVNGRCHYCKENV